MKEQSTLRRSDPALQESQMLDLVLKNEQVKKVAVKPRVSVTAARSGVAQVATASQRTTTRLLFISQDTNLLNQATKSLDGYLNVADMFNEVHIIVLQPGIRTKHSVLRVADNVWVYVASATHSWWTPVIALRIIRDHLVFAGGFRPDLIVARDGFESALTTYIAAKKYHRPAQLHLLQDQGSVASNARRSRLWRYVSRFVVAHFMSIRTTTHAQAEALSRQYPDSPDIKELPKFHNFKPLTEAAPTLHIKAVYHDFSFILLYVGDLTREGKAFQAIDAARELLRNPRVGLVMLGDGPAYSECVKRVSLLNITAQVVFEKRTELRNDFMATADVILVPDNDTTSDEVMLQAAALGRPLVLVETAARTDLFQDGISVLFFAPGDVAGASRQLKRVLNDITLRRSLGDAIQTVAATRLNDDPLRYQQAYRDSIEQAFFLDEEDFLPPSE